MRIQRLLVAGVSMASMAALLSACSRDAVFPTAADELSIPSAITYGTTDGDRHPEVGIMVATDANGAPLWRCSGTLISPTVYLTAGHCTDGAAGVELWFAEDITGNRPGNGYPFTGEVRGTPYTHPDYPLSSFVRADVGVVVLEQPITLARYGQLPAEDALEALARGRGLQNQMFTAVGYGLQRTNPVFTESDVRRMVATPHLMQINTALTGSYSLLLSNNANTGGTCFGDSGGPNFVGTSNVVGAVTSYGINSNCAGSGGVFRMDRKSARDWVLTFLQ
jgi:hypothetical protein